VNRKVMVKNLNAQYLGGLIATGLALTGGGGITGAWTNTPISGGGPLDVVATTGKLPAGTYYVSATAQLYVAAGDSYGYCYIAISSDPSYELNLAGAQQEGTFQAAETVVLTVKAGTAFNRYVSPAATTVRTRTTLGFSRSAFLPTTTE
jgi:hypothetical protein